MLILALLLFASSPARAETRTINTDKVRGTVSNLDWSYLNVDPDGETREGLKDLIGTVRKRNNPRRVRFPGI